jgi:hypothetical protein
MQAAAQGRQTRAQHGHRPAVPGRRLLLRIAASGGQPVSAQAEQLKLVTLRVTPFTPENVKPFGQAGLHMRVFVLKLRRGLCRSAGCDGAYRAAGPARSKASW